MKAIAYEAYGSADILEVKDVPKPDVDADRVLIRVRAASANPYDWHFMRGLPLIARTSMGLRKPKYSLLGSDVAGEVEAVGGTVARVRPGGGGFGVVGAGGLAGVAFGPAKRLVFEPGK